jgi:predicted transcriptional regulator
VDKIRAWLKTYGLNDTEISVFLCILKHPKIKTAEIQRQTGLVRTSIYYSLAQLKTDGLISENIQNNIKTYRVASTDTLRLNIESTIKQENQKLEQLGSLDYLFEHVKTSATGNDSFVARFEGARSIKQAIEGALRCESKKWHIIAARDNFLYHTSKSYQGYYLNERKRRKIIAKTLWEPVKTGTVPSVEDIFYRHPKHLPNNFLGTFKSLVILYDDTTLIIDSYDQKTAHAINNRECTNLIRLMHECIWQRSTKI